MHRHTHTQPRHGTRLHAAVLGVGAVAALALTADAATFTWLTTNTAAGTYSWDAAGNWENAAYPSAAGDTAVISSNLTGNETINLNRAITIGALTLGDSVKSNSYTIAPNGGSLTFDNGSSDAQLTVLSTSNGDTISAGIGLTSNLAVTQNGAALTISGAISGAEKSLIKSGTGSLVLTKANSYTGTTFVNAGTLTLDFSASGAPAGNILNASSTLALGGGTLTLKGKASTTNSQTVNGLVLLSGTSALGIANNATANPTLFTLGAITRNTGATLNLTQPANGAVGATNGYATTNTNVNGILGGWITVSNTTWAATDGTNIVAFTGYVNDTWAAGNNVTVTTSGAPAADSTVNSLRFVPSGTQTLTLSGTNTITSGGILVTATTGTTNPITITGGTLRGANGQDLVVIQTNTGNEFTISSVIADNGAATGLTKSGAGTLVLGAANTYTGTTVINGGTVKLTNAAALGADGSTTVIRTGGSLNLAGGTVGSRNLTLSGGTLYNDGGTATWSGPITLTNDSSITGPYNNGARIVISGNISGTGNLSLGSKLNTIVLSGSNSFTGTIFVGSNLSNPGGLILTGGNAVPDTCAIIGAAFSPITFSSGETVGSISTTYDIYLNGNTLTTGGNNNSTTIAAPIRYAKDSTGNAGSLVKTGAGTLTLTATAYTGTTTINGGTLQLGNGGTAGTVAGTGLIVDNATLAVYRSDDFTFSNTVSGSGLVNKLGTNVLTMSASNSYNGGTLLSGGTLKSGHGSAFGTGVITLAAGTLDLRDFNVANAIDITGTGVSVLLPTSAGALTTSFAAGSGFRGWQRQSSLGNGTLAQLLGGATAGAATVTSSWSASTNTSVVVSDVLDIKGLDGTTFVLQLNYADTGKGDAWEQDNAYLAWLNGSGKWVNSVLGNNNGSGTPGTHYLTAYDPGATYNLGDWGVDATSNTVWAVINHNSEFGVVVPEPAALTLLGLGSILLLRRRHGPR